MAVAVFAYFNRDSGIAGEPGTLLVIVSSALLAIFGWIMASGIRSRAFRIFITISAILNIAGTGLAGYLLHSSGLVVLMLLGLIGWLFHVFAPRRALV